MQNIHNDIFDFFTLLGDAFTLLNNLVMSLNLYIGTHHVGLYTLLGATFCIALIHILIGVETDDDFNACNLNGYGDEDW